MWLGLSKNRSFKYLFFFKKWHFILFKKKSLNLFFIIYKNYFYKFYTKLKILFYSNLNVIKLFRLLTPFYFEKNYKINIFYTITSLFIFNKLKFDGKGYYLYKNKRNVLGMQFNYSHKLNIYSNKIFIKFFTKKSWLFFGSNCLDLSYLVSYIKNFRSINIFTLQGIRFRNQIILSKPKKS